MAINKLAIDFDSNMTNIYLYGSGLVLSEPTVACVDETGKIKYAGTEAKKFIGKTGKNSKIVFPVLEGDIVNEKIAQGVLSYFLEKLEIKKNIFGTNVLFSLPCGFDKKIVDKYQRISKNCGISKVSFVETPILSAIGMKTPLTESNPSFVIDMAGGVTNIATVSLGGVISGFSVNYGTNKICTDIIDYVSFNYGLQIGLLTAERLKNEIGSLEEGDNLSTIVNGRDSATGSPKSISLKATDIIEPIKKYFDKIAEIALSFLRKLPPEISAEIKHTGVNITGVSSKIYGLEKYYSDKFSIPIKIADSPEYAVALGGGVVLGDSSFMKNICLD